MKTPSFLNSVLLAAGLLATPVTAQQTTPPSACKTDEAFRAFDFWVGDWDVYPNGSDTLAGTNKIEVIENGCALLETWSGASGTSGISTNHFNPVTGKWRQLWLSAGAYSIDYEGGLKDGAMVMEGHIYYYNQNAVFPFRGTWTPQPDGTVRQFFEQYNPQTEQWATWFDGIYKRQNQAE